MTHIRDLFESSRKLDRRIEKVITFEATEGDQLKREITEYVVTGNIEASFERLLDQIDTGISGGGGEIGVWVSGFYGSGKSSFTKYLGFSLDPAREMDGRQFLAWMQDQIESGPLRQRLATVAKRHPSAVVMIDLASAQIAGATMAEISTVLYWTVLAWAGYPRDKKLAHLQLMLERDGKMADFEKRITEISKGKTWKAIQNQSLVAGQFAGRAATELYPELYPDEASFQRQRIDEVVMEDERVTDMINLVRRVSGRENVIFILDEVGQYIASRSDLILNLDGLAKNIKNIGGGKVWLIATAQQRLTEDDENAQLNKASLFKLKDRFPIDLELEANDIREICYRRLLTKSPQGDESLKALFAKHGPSLTHHTALTGSRYYKSDFDEKTFVELYPFLPQHFDILLEMLGRLAKTSGGMGLRSAIKVIQDVLVDKSGYRTGQTLLADDAIGKLATTVVFYDALRRDINRSFPHLVTGVDKTIKSFGDDSMEARVAKTVAVLQVLNDFPISRENIAALIHESVDASGTLEAVRAAVEAMQSEQAIPLSELDGKLLFMSEKVSEVEDERARINVSSNDVRRELNTLLGDKLFTPLPSARLGGTRSITAGTKSFFSGLLANLAGGREPVQVVIELVPAVEYDRRREERLVDSGLPANRNTIYLIAREPSGLDRTLEEIVRSAKIWSDNRNKTVEKEVTDYLIGQKNRAENLRGTLEGQLRTALAGGSFIFRSVPIAAATLDADVIRATNRQLDEAAAKIFSKYHLAPLQAEGTLAEKFLRVPNLAAISSQLDPLTLVSTQGGQKKVNVDHPALIAIRDYLDLKGQVEGGTLQDDFFAPEFGWSKDATRYLVAVLLVAGLIKLRVAGADVLVKGDTAIDALKNNNNFKRIGVALRNAPISLETKDRAATRVMELTGESVMPLEQDISQAVVRHFPGFLTDYSPLATRLDGLDLPGSDRARSLQEDLKDILKADASDATPVLGAEKCEIHASLLWARKLATAFDNGIDETVRALTGHLNEIEGLPEEGAVGDLRIATDATCSEARELLACEDFFDRHTDLKNALASLQSAVRSACGQLAGELNARLDAGISMIQALPEWLRIGQEEQAAFSAQLENLRVTAGDNLAALKSLMGQSYRISVGLDQTRTEVLAMGAEPLPPEPDPKDPEKPPREVRVTLLASLSSVAELDASIGQLQNARQQLLAGTKIIIDLN